MKKYLLLIFIVLAGCCNSDPKFHFGATVTFKKGFYKGCSSRIESVHAPFWKNEYGLRDLKCPNGFKSNYESAYESELE